MNALKTNSTESLHFISFDLDFYSKNWALVVGKSMLFTLMLCALCVYISSHIQLPWSISTFFSFWMSMTSSKIAHVSYRANLIRMLFWMQTLRHKEKYVESRTIWMSNRDQSQALRVTNWRSHFAKIPRQFVTYVNVTIVGVWICHTGFKKTFGLTFIFEIYVVLELSVLLFKIW